MELGNFGFSGGGGGALPIIHGGGTLNYLAKFTPNGITIGDSLLFDNGVSVGIGLIAPTARFHVKGAGNTNATFTAKFQNSSNVESLVVSDDGSVYNLGAGSVALNTAYGKGALVANTVGTENTAMGCQGLFTNTTANYNTAIGYLALYTNNADWNTAVGVEALYTNSTGTNNVALGALALKFNSVGIENTAIGTGALYSANTNYNTAIGSNALRNSSGSANTAVGQTALYNNLSGNNLTAFGKDVLYNNTSGTENTSFGYRAGFSNSTGSGSVFIGSNAGYYETLSNKLFIDNATRASEADARLKALVYGIFDATVANQRFLVNGRIQSAGNYESVNATFDVILWNGVFPNVGSGTRNTFLGSNDTGGVGLTTGTDNTVVGSFSNVSLTSGGRNIFLGTGGALNITDGSFNISFGGSHANTSITGSLSFFGAVTASNQAVFGGSASYNDFYFGRGISVPDVGYGITNLNMYATSITAGTADQQGIIREWIFNASVGTGTGIGGDFVFKVAPSSTTANTQNTLLEAVRIVQDGSFRLSPKPNVTEDTTGGTIGTTDATANVVAQTIAIPANKVLGLAVEIVYRKTAGAGVGAVGQGSRLRLDSTVQNIAGVLTLGTIQNTYTDMVNAIAGVSATLAINGTNIEIQVTGVLNDNITWNVISKLNAVA